MRVTRWRLPAFLLAAIAVAAIAPAAAGATTKIGSTFAPGAESCVPGGVAFQTSTSAGGYVVPSNGVLTSWSFQAGSTPPTNLKIVVARETTPNKFFVLGTSANKSPTPNTVNTYTDLYIPVQAGSVIGERSEGDKAQCGLLGAGNIVHYVGSTDPTPGSPVEAKLTSELLLDLSAELNLAPVADAGTGQEVAPGANVALDGSGSTDPDGDALSYEWRQTSGSQVTLNGANTATPSFTAPKRAGDVGFELEVCDTTFQCDEDGVTVTVQEEPPTANAGPDQEVDPGVTVSLNGSGSVDPNGEGVTYEWKQTGGTTVGLIGASAAKPRFTAPQPAGPLSFELKACDPVTCATDGVVITVRSVPKPPAAKPDTTLKSTKIVKQKVTFKFSSSKSSSTFRCKLDKKAFAKCGSPKTYKNLKAGQHKFQVKAVDAEGAADPSPVTRKFKIKG